MIFVYAEMAAGTGIRHSLLPLRARSRHVLTFYTIDVAEANDDLYSPSTI